MLNLFLKICKDNMWHSHFPAFESAPAIKLDLQFVCQKCRFPIKVFCWGSPSIMATITRKPFNENENQNQTQLNWFASNTLLISEDWSYYETAAKKLIFDTFKTFNSISYLLQLRNQINHSCLIMVFKLRCSLFKFKKIEIFLFSTLF